MYLLDTHILFWWGAGEHSRLSGPQRRVLDKAVASNARLAISAISLWELAFLAHRDRIEPPRPVDIWLTELENDSGIAVMPITGKISYEAVRLAPAVPGDPVDRIIVATALCHGLTLLTVDRRIREAKVIQVL